MINNNYTKHDSSTLLEVDEGVETVLVVWNDDFNTFDWVINSLIEVCDHTPEQAEQSALSIHYKGKCDVKKGDKSLLIPMERGLLDRGISAEIMG